MHSATNSGNAPYAPWIGLNYRTANPRVMLVGESHYVSNPSDDAPTLTCDIVEAVRDGQRSLAFYSKVARLIGGEAAATPEGRVAFWNRVVFFNYVPMSVGQWFNAVPTDTMWQAAGPRFTTLLLDLSPTHVVSLGKRQWNRIEFPQGWSSSETTNEHVRLWRSPSDQRFLATWVNHPSSRGFSVAKWTTRINTLLSS